MAIPVCLAVTGASGQSDMITTVAGSGSFGIGSGSFSGDGGPATSALLNQPEGVAVDASGNLFIADSFNNRIRKVTPSGIITTLAGNGNGGFSGDGGPATSAELNQPVSVAVDASGNIFFVDFFNNRIRKVSASGIITTVAGSGTFGCNNNHCGGFSGDGGPATSALLNYPYGVAVDTSGNLFIADSFNNRIRKVSAGGIITTVAGTGNGCYYAGCIGYYAGGFSGDGGPATAAQLAVPRGIAVDASGNLFIADCYNERIRKVSGSGIITTVAGSGNFFIAQNAGPGSGYANGGYSGDGGPATSALLNSPYGVAVDVSGNLFIVDDGNDRIRKVSASGIITTFAGNGNGGFSGDGGPATSAGLNYPYGIAVETSGDLFIADTSNNRIREVNIAMAAAPPLITRVANSASWASGAVAPGEIVTITGSMLGPSTGVPGLVSLSTGNWTTQLGGTMVLFGGVAAPLLYVSSSQVNAVVPFEVAGCTQTTLQVQYQGVSSIGTTLPCVGAAPGLFTFNASGVGQAAAANQDDTLNGASSPAAKGSYVTMYFTGGGQTNPPGVTGSIAGTSTLQWLAQTALVTVGGVAATVAFDGAAPTYIDGFLQLNIQLSPDTPSGNALPVVITIGGISSPAAATLAVQ